MATHQAKIVSMSIIKTQYQRIILAEESEQRYDINVNDTKMKHLTLNKSSNCSVYSISKIIIA